MADVVFDAIEEGVELATVCDIGLVEVPESAVLVSLDSE